MFYCRVGEIKGIKYQILGVNIPSFDRLKSRKNHFFMEQDSRVQKRIGSYILRRNSEQVLLTFRALFVGIILSLLLPGSSLASFIQLDGVADVKTRFSDGCSTVTDLAGQAKSMAIDVVIFSDHARNSLEYGLSPFERLLKKTQGGPSVLSAGVGGYLLEINDIDRQTPDILLIPGLEVAPFYHWTGSPFKKNLVANDWDKHLMIVGLETEADIKQIPLLHSNYSSKYFKQFQSLAIGLTFLFLISATAVSLKYKTRITLPLSFLFFLLALNNHPFKSSPFDPYHGSQNIAPYQEVIDYANSKGALVFWNHMETLSGSREFGSVKLETPPYPQDLLVSQGHHGFQAVTGSPDTMTEPGREWDQALMQYQQGLRDQPIWGYGGNDFHCDYSAGPVFGSVRTIFLVRSRTREAIFDAMKNGRMYSVRQPSDDRLSLDQFVVSDIKTGGRATMGETLQTMDFPEINVKVRSTKGGEKTATIVIIRNGEIVKQETVSLPYNLTWRDLTVNKQASVYYRVNVKVSSVDHLVSNPIFVRFDPGPAEVASFLSKREKAIPTRPPVQPKVESPAISAPVDPSPVENIVAQKPRTTENPQVAKAPVPTKPQKPVAVKPPRAAQTKKPRARSEGTWLKVLRDGTALKKGPATNFPDGATLNKGDRVLLVRRTKIEFNKKFWLMVKHKGQRGYIWEGLVAEENDGDQSNE
jgi:hypothetical protein